MHGLRLWECGGGGTGSSTGSGTSSTGQLDWDNALKGENLGLPTGFTFKWPTIWQTLGIFPIDNWCDFGPCVLYQFPSGAGGTLPGSLPELVAKPGLLDRLSSCFTKNFADPALGTSAVLGFPLPKKLFGLPIGFGDASRVTNPISLAGRALKIPDLTGRLAKLGQAVSGTSRVGGVLGRINVTASQALFVKDATKTFACVANF